MTRRCLTIIGGLALAAAACHPSAKTRGSHTPETPENSGPRTTRATDPEPGADRCTAYTLDGIAIGMARSEVERIATLRPVLPSSSLIPGFEKNTFAFRATRHGRADEVQIAFTAQTEDPKVAYLRANIFVGKADPWPSSLFDLLGSPQLARVGDWIWTHRACWRTLHLTRVEPLGGGEAQPYLLEIKEMEPHR